MKTGTILKALIMAVTLSSPVSAWGMSFEQSDSDELAPVRLCGIIYRHKEHGQTSSDDVVKITLGAQATSDDPMIIGQDQNTAQILDTIRWPNHAYYGCVSGDSLPQQGFEGSVFVTSKIELLAQPTGFSVGN